MPVNNKHPQYEYNFDKWNKCRVCIAGEEAVKAVQELYLPKLSGQTTTEYKAYRDRAQFFNGTARVKEAFVGMMFKKDPAIEATTSVRDELETVGKERESINIILRECVDEVVSTGRVIAMVDADKNSGNNPYIGIYKAEDLINWKTETDKEGREHFTLAVFMEEYSKEDVDEFNTKKYPQIRVLDLFEGYYRVRIYRRSEDRKVAGKEEWIIEDEIIPQIRGKKLDFLPIVVMGTNDISATVEKPPLLDVANVNLSLYRTSADLEHGRHFTALPTGYIAGGKLPRGQNLYLGGSKFLMIDNEQAELGYLEFSGAGLKSLSEAVKEKKDDMAVLGARILIEEKTGVEAAETAKIRKSGESSVLSTIADTVSKGVTKAAQWWREWKGGASTDITVKINRDFLDFIADIPTLQMLLLGVQSNQISWQTFYYNLQRAELVPEGRTMEEEIELIDAGGPIGPANEVEEEDNDNKEEDEE